MRLNTIREGRYIMKKIFALLLAALLLFSATTALASDRYDLDDYGYRTVKTGGPVHSPS